MASRTVSVQSEDTEDSEYTGKIQEYIKKLETLKQEIDTGTLVKKKDQSFEEAELARLKGLLEEFEKIIGDYLDLDGTEVTNSFTEKDKELKEKADGLVTEITDKINNKKDGIKKEAIKKYIEELEELKTKIKQKID